MIFGADCAGNVEVFVPVHGFWHGERAGSRKGLARKEREIWLKKLYALLVVMELIATTGMTARPVAIAETTHQSQMRSYKI